jgi:hypothetical protein
VLELTELPAMPLVLGNQLMVESLGKFLIPSARFPVERVSHREHFSPDNPAKQCSDCSSTDQPEFTFHTSSGIWEQVSQELQTAREKIGIPKRQGTNVSGRWMYAFSFSVVLACFRLIANQGL